MKREIGNRAERKRRKRKGSDSRQKGRECFFLELVTGKEKLGRSSNGKKKKEKFEFRSRGEGRN